MADETMIEFSEAARVLDVSEYELENLVIAGTLTAHRHPNSIMFEKVDIKDYVMTRRAGRPEEEMRKKRSTTTRKAREVAAKLASLSYAPEQRATAIVRKRLAKQSELPEVAAREPVRKVVLAPEPEAPPEKEEDLAAVVADLRATVSDLSEENERLKNETAAGQPASEEASATLAAVQQEKEHLAARLAAAEETLNTVQKQAAEVTKLKTETREIRAELERARSSQAQGAAVAGSAQGTAELEQQLRAVTQERDKLVANLGESTKRAGKLEAKLGTAHAERDRYAQRAQEAEATQQIVDRKLSKTMKRAEKAEAKLQAAKEKLAKVKQDTAAVVSERDEALKSTVKGAAEEAERLEAELQQVQEAAAEGKSQLDALRMEAAKKDGVIESLQGQASKAEGLEGEVRSLTKQLAEAKARTSKTQDLEGEVHALTEQLAEAKAKAAEAPVAADAPTPVVAPTPVRAAAPAAEVEEAAPAPPPEPEPGKLPRGVPSTIGKFELLQVIGEGRYGQVILAENAFQKEKVVVRLLPSSYSDDKEYVERFRKQMRTVAELESKSVINVLDEGATAGRLYVVMELLEGGSLRTRIEEGETADDDAASWLLQLTKALEVVRRAKLVHREIRPANILFTADGVPKLSDLGLSRGTVEDGMSFVEIEGKAGVLCYAAPEVTLGGTESDIRADIFSMGAVAYHMLTGQPPFRGDDFKDIERLFQKEATVPWPAQVRSGIPEQLCWVIAKMMSRSPENRYETPRDLAADLMLASSGKQMKSALPEKGTSCVEIPG